MGLSRSRAAAVESLENRLLFALDHGVDPANLGKGDWLWTMTAAQTNIAQQLGVASVTTQQVFNFLRDKGMKWVIVKAGDGNDGPSKAGTLYTQFTPQIIQEAHNAGLKIFGYQYVYGGADPAPKTATTTVQGEIAVAKEILALNPDGLVIDAEGQYERVPAANGGPTGAATTYMQAIRAVYPNTFIAHAPLPYITLHTAFPYEAFGKYCDAVMPQAYWKTLYDVPAGTKSIHPAGAVLTPEWMVDDLDSEWSYWQNVWAGRGNAASIKPIIPIAQGYNPGSMVMDGSEITRFYNALKADTHPASPTGYDGISFWSVQHHTTSMWNAIGANTIGNPEITVTRSGSNIADNQPGTVSFGSVVQGSAGPTITFTVKNDGVVPLTLSGLSVATGFSVTDGLVASLAPGASDNFTVRLDTSVVGTKMGQISFNNNDPNENPFNFPISGTVTAPIVGGSISGNLFNDLNANGVKNTGEGNLSSRTVYIDLDNDLVLDANEKSTTTDSNGNYKLAALAAGTYKVRQVLPAGWTQTTPSNGYGINVTLSTNQNVTGKNFGSRQATATASISGTVFNDLNDNGVKNTGELGIQGRTVFIDLDNDYTLDANEKWATTDGSGNYILSGLVAGTYKVRTLQPAGWVQTTPANGYGLNVTLSAGQKVTAKLFGSRRIA
jgi:hypothetical protein